MRRARDALRCEACFDAYCASRRREYVLLHMIRHHGDGDVDIQVRANRDGTADISRAPASHRTEDPHSPANDGQTDHHKAKQVRHEPKWQ